MTRCSRKALRRRARRIVELERRAAAPADYVAEGWWPFYFKSKYSRKVFTCKNLAIVVQCFVLLIIGEECMSESDEDTSILLTFPPLVTTPAYMSIPVFCAYVDLSERDFYRAAKLADLDFYRTDEGVRLVKVQEASTAVSTYKQQRITKTMTLKEFYSIIDALEPDERGCLNFPEERTEPAHNRVAIFNCGQFGVGKLVLARKLGRSPIGKTRSICNNPLCANLDHLYDGGVRQDFETLLQQELMQKNSQEAAE